MTVKPTNPVRTAIQPVSRSSPKQANSRQGREFEKQLRQAQSGAQRSSQSNHSPSVFSDTASNLDDRSLRSRTAELSGAANAATSADTESSGELSGSQSSLADLTVSTSLSPVASAAVSPLPDKPKSMLDDVQHQDRKVDSLSVQNSLPACSVAVQNGIYTPVNQTPITLLGKSSAPALDGLPPPLQSIADRLKHELLGVQGKEAISIELVSTGYGLDKLIAQPLNNGQWLLHLIQRHSQRPLNAGDIQRLKAALNHKGLAVSDIVVTQKDADS